MDAIFRIVATGRHWAAGAGPDAAGAGPDAAPADTVHRQYRRWAKAGVFARLLARVARKRGVPTALRGLEHWICAAHRRSVGVLGLRAIVLARRQGMLSALPGPSWLLPDPVLMARLQAIILDRLAAIGRDTPRPWEFRAWRRLMRVFAGRPRIPRSLVPA